MKRAPHAEVARCRLQLATLQAGRASPWAAVKVWTNALPAVTLVTYRAGRVSGLVRAMFVSDQRLCPVSIGAARARLVNLAHDGWLGRASVAAYHDGLDQLLRVGPFGEVPGLSRRVRAHFLDPADRDGSVTLGMRWEAIGVTGRLFPALDADITLGAEGDQRTRITLTGVYRSPLGALGAGLDRALLHHVATATIHSLLAHISEALEGTAPEPGDADAPGWWQPRRVSPYGVSGRRRSGIG